MDMLTLAMAKNYSDSKGGYVERTSELCDNPRTLDAGVLQGNVAISPAIDVGELFAVTINGKRYERRAENGIINEEERAYIGNLKFVGGSNNGDPFLVYSSAGSRKHIFYAVDPITLNTDTERTYTVERITETIHPIDPKFIPAMDSITLNGADGKRYKVAVNESGVLTATAIE